MNGEMDRQVGIQGDRWTDTQTVRWTDRWKDRQTDRWMDIRMDRNPVRLMGQKRDWQTDRQVYR